MALTLFSSVISETIWHQNICVFLVQNRNIANWYLETIRSFRFFKNEIDTNVNRLNSHDYLHCHHHYGREVVTKILVTEVMVAIATWYWSVSVLSPIVRRGDGSVCKLVWCFFILVIIRFVVGFICLVWTVI